MTDTYFVIHSKKDHDAVEPIVKGLQAMGFRLWLDTMLTPGENWERAITEHIYNARGLLVFLSHASLAESGVQRQLEILAQGRTAYVVPILLEANVSLPTPLQSIARVDVAADTPAEAVQHIGTALQTLPAPPTDETCIEMPHANALAHVFAETRRGSKMPAPRATVPNSIFIVHGHDLELRDWVDSTLREWGIETVILQQIDAAHDSLFQKFLTFSEDVEFAVVLMTADDYGASRRQYDAPNVGDRALQFRARQNVILELGFFYGYLGWENVFVLYKPPAEVFPNFEIPSDLGGILFDQIDPDGNWKDKLIQRLRAAGFQL